MTGQRSYEVALIHGGAGDGSGPEMMDAALRVLKALTADLIGAELKFVELESAEDPGRRWETLLSLGVVFKAPTTIRHSPKEQVADIAHSVAIRKALNLYANITPCKSYGGVAKALRPNIDMVMVREGVEGLRGNVFFWPAPGVCSNIRTISQEGSERVARVAFELAQRRRRKVTVCALPPSVIQNEEIFIEACSSVAKAFPDVEMEVIKPDSFAGSLVDRPEYYDVIVVPNDWGCILQDLVVATTGSVGLGPRANLGDKTALFEPVHGTAPGKAGKGTVNPISQILAGKMMLEWLGTRHEDEHLIRVAHRLERAVTDVLDAGKTLTVDLGGMATTRQMVDAIVERARVLRGQ